MARVDLLVSVQEAFTNYYPEDYPNKLRQPKLVMIRAAYKYARALVLNNENKKEPFDHKRFKHLSGLSFELLLNEAIKILGEEPESEFDDRLEQLRRLWKAKESTDLRVPN